MAQQFLRKTSLVVPDGSTQIDLSQLRYVFNVRQSDLQSPNNVTIDVYNLSDATAKKIQKEYTQVTLQAGYAEGPFGIIFSGTVRRVFRGKKQVNSIVENRESPTDTYLRIMAAEGDDPYNFSTINKTLSAGWTSTDVAQSLSDSFGKSLGTLPVQFGGNPAPRGKVLYGMSRDHMRNLTIPNGSRWNLSGGSVQIISNTAYLQNEVVSLNSKTGMIGMPQQTEDGIIVSCLLNPNIKIGTAVKINNADVQKQSFSPDYTAFNYPPPVSDDGLYRVLVAEHEGDTRGDMWLTHLTCLSIDQSAAADNSVPAFPTGS